MTSVKIPTDRVVYQLPHATVIYTRNHSLATGRTMPSLKIQAHDQYRYQRELSVAFRHRPGDSSDLYWECHAYQHPGRRNIQENIPDSVARRFISRFLDLCASYPALLFNATGDHATDPGRPRHEGFVHLHDALLWGAELSVKLLD
jgi:hypothetical protein